MEAILNHMGWTRTCQRSKKATYINNWCKIPAINSFTWFLNRDCYWDTSVAHGAWSQVWLVSAHGKFGKSDYSISRPKIIATILTRIPDHHHHHQQQQQQHQSSFWSFSSCTAIMHISHLFLNTRTWSYYVFICNKTSLKVCCQTHHTFHKFVMASSWRTPKNYT